MKKTIPGAVAALAILCFSAAPADAQNREHQQMAAELRMLQEQSQQLSLAVAQTLAQLTEAVKKIEARLDATDAATRKAMADQKLIIDSLSTEMRVIRERTQDTNTRIGTLTEEIEAMRMSLASGAPQPPPTDSAPAAPGDAASTQPPASRSGLSPNRLSQIAWSDYTSGNYSLAISGYQQLLNEFPKSQDADDAQFYIGMSYAAQKKYTEAVAAFNAVIQNYPTGDKVPNAYLELGQAQRSLGQNEAARSAWETVLKNYADSGPAFVAKQRLEGLPAPTAPR